MADREASPEPRRPASRRRVPVAPAPPPATRPAPPQPVVDVPVRRRRLVVGLAAEAAAQAERRRGGLDPREPPRGPNRPTRAPTVPAGGGGADPGPVVGTCRCGHPAHARCAGACGRPTCGEHLRTRSTREASGGSTWSERQHTAYVFASSAGGATRCVWCREAAADAAVAALAPSTALPADVVARLGTLLRRPHEHPRGAWDSTVRAHGGPLAVARLLGPRLSQRRPAMEFDGRRRGEVLAGVSVFRDGRRRCEVVDATGLVWAVRAVDAGVVRRRQAWAWAPVPEERVAQLLPRLVELVDP